MKTKFIYGLLLLLIVSSCAVQSINPFFTEKNVTFSEDIIGEWSTKGNDHMIIESYTSFIAKKNDLTSHRSKEDQKKMTPEQSKMRAIYQKGYVISFTEKIEDDRAVTDIFNGVLFKINNEWFMDFSINELNDSVRLSSIGKTALTGVHLVAKVSMKDSGLTFEFLTEKVMTRPHKKGRIRISHEYLYTEKLRNQPIIDGKLTGAYYISKKYSDKSTSEDWQEWVINLTPKS